MHNSKKNDVSAIKRDSFFGRRKGPRLRNYQQKLIDQFLPKQRLNIDTVPPLQIRDSFNPKNSYKYFILEIGFGGGERLFYDLQKNPDTVFFGVEPFINGIAKFLKNIILHPELQKRIHLFDDDASLLLDWLPAHCLDRIDLFYPDPWPKKKHWKRRFVQEKNLSRIARVLKPKAHFRFVSDSDNYVNWTLAQIDRHPSFQWECPSTKSWYQAFEDWVTTRYETKALNAGRRPIYLTFQRL